MGILVASVAALLVGPLVERFSRGRAEATALLDGFVLFALLGIVGLVVLPHSLVLGGVWAALAAAVGFVIPPALERRLGNLADPLHGAMLWLAMLGLAVHSLLDGAAMVGDGHGGHGPGDWLAWSVVLHNVPMGLAIWWAVRHNRGLRAAVSVMVLMAAATAAGYVGAEPLVRALPLTALATFQALVAGSLLHVVLGHQPHDLGATVRGMQRYAAVGAILALAGLLTVGVDEHEAAAGVSSTTDAALDLALSAAPALLGALLLTSLVRGLAGPPPPSWLLAGGAVVRAAKGTVFRLRVPMCSSGALPSYRHLVESGLPVGAAMATLVAMPGLGFDAILVTAPLLGLELTLARVVGVVGLAMLMGLVVGSRTPDRSAAPSHDQEAAPTPRRSLVAGLRFAFGDLLDHVGPWMVVAIAAGAVMGPLLQARWLAGLGGAVGVVLMALAGLPGYVSASAATVVVAVLVHKGLSPGAAIAFLLTAPTTNATTLQVLRELHGRRSAASFAGLAIGVAVAAGLGVDALAGRVNLPAVLDQVVTPKPWQVASLIVLAIALLASLWRQGPRAMAAQVFDPHDEHDHHHDHHHHEHHCHDDHDGEAGSGASSHPASLASDP